MLIYDKKDKSIDIYTIEAKKEELKKYRRNVLNKHRDELLSYGLKTNCKDTTKKLLTLNEINIADLNYDNSTPNSEGYWSWITKMQDFGSCYHKKETQEIILEKYIDGTYDSSKPTRVYEYNFKEQREHEVYRLLKTEIPEIISSNSRGDVYAIKNMIDLPRNLYLLHLLLQGEFSKLTHESITRQLQLFDIDYSKSVNISDIEDMISTGLVSGTIEEAIKKAEIGSIILKKVKK